MYSSPLVLLPSGEVVKAPVEWDGENSGISIKLPADTHPLVVVFGVGSKVPEDTISLLPRRLKTKSPGQVADAPSSSDESSSSEGEKVVGKAAKRRSSPKDIEVPEHAGAATFTKKPITEKKPEVPTGQQTKKTEAAKPAAPAEKKPTTPAQAPQGTKTSTVKKPEKVNIIPFQKSICNNPF